MDNSQNTFKNAGNVAQVPSGTVPLVQQAPPTPAPMGNTNVLTVGNPSEKPPRNFSAVKKIIKIFLGLIFILAVISVVIFIAISKVQESLPGKGKMVMRCTQFAMEHQTSGYRQQEHFE